MKTPENGTFYITPAEGCEPTWLTRTGEVNLDKVLNMVQTVFLQHPGVKNGEIFIGNLHFLIVTQDGHRGLYLKTEEA